MIVIINPEAEADLERIGDIIAEITRFGQLPLSVNYASGARGLHMHHAAFRWFLDTSTPASVGQSTAII